MRLWAVLYAAIWVVLLEFLLAMVPQGEPWLGYGHAALGLVIVALAYYDFDQLRETVVPGRIKRTASASFYLSIVVAVLGFLLLFNVGTTWSILWGFTVWDVILFFHVLNAFAIITQMAAVAIAFDMWEEKEFLEVSRPGEVPRAPPPFPVKKA